MARLLKAVNLLALVNENYYNSLVYSRPLVNIKSLI
jgi:hypothetical protein